MSAGDPEEFARLRAENKRLNMLLHAHGIPLTMNAPTQVSSDAIDSDGTIASMRTTRFRWIGTSFALLIFCSGHAAEKLTTSELEALSIHVLDIQRAADKWEAVIKFPDGKLRRIDASEKFVELPADRDISAFRSLDDYPPKKAVIVLFPLDSATTSMFECWRVLANTLQFQVNTARFVLPPAPARNPWGKIVVTDGDSTDRYLLSFLTTVNELDEMMRSTDAAARQRAVFALQSIPTPEATQLLLNALSDLDAEIASRASSALDRRSPAIRAAAKVARDKAEKASIQYAAATGDLRRVKDLATSEQIINAKRQDGATALYLAAQEGKLEVVAHLLSVGAKTDIKAKDGSTPLIIASQNNHREVVTLLLTKDSAPSYAAPNGATALHVAAEKGHADIVKLLLDAGVSPDLQVAPHWATALYFAAQFGHVAVVDELLGRKASVDANSFDGQTALTAAAQFGHSAIVQKLLDAGAKPNKRNSNGSFALEAAAEYGHLEILDMLLSRGAIIESRDKNGSTALARAAQAGNSKIVAALILAGAKVDSTDDGGVTPLMLASARLTGTATEAMRAATVAVLLAKGANPNVTSKTGVTALLTAVRFNHKEIVKSLLAAGADSAATFKGKSPMDLAESPEIKSLLRKTTQTLPPK